MSDLLPCPFCGKTPEVNFGRTQTDVWAYIRCCCGVTTANQHGDNDREAKRKALDVWNRRER